LHNGVSALVYLVHICELAFAMKMKMQNKDKEQKECTLYLTGFYILLLMKIMLIYK